MPDARRPILRGRRRESDALERLLDDVRASRSRALVVRGEPGIGKTALLDHLVAQASGCRVAQLAGVEAEMELAFAGVHQLCGPLLDRLPHLPAPQREALRSAFGVSAVEPPDRFLVSLGVLGLLSEAAEQQPLLCVVDDAQWLDRVSAQILAFVARRLLAEPIGLVFALREPSADQELAGLPQLDVGALSRVDARALLEAAVPGRLDARVRDRIIAETLGNPLALLELPQGLTTAELAGGFALPDAAPLASRIEQSFQRRLQALPAQTQLLMLAAAAEPVGDVTLLWRAAEQLGIGPEAGAPAAASGLLELGARVRFRHPLVRSAAYRAATPSQRRDVHLALARATEPGVDPDRRAWHLAHAATGPDEAVAVELERSAGRARSRGGVAAAAAFLERAAALTPEPAARARRALAAARAKFEAAAPDVALDLLATAEIGPLDDLQQARLERLRAQIAFTTTRGSQAPRLLLHAARRLERLDATAARETYLDALWAAVYAGRLADDGWGVAEVAEAARRGPPGPHPSSPGHLLLEGLVLRFTEGYPAAVPPLRDALDAFVRGPVQRADDGRWLWLAWCVACELWDDQTWELLAVRNERLTRDDGAVSALPVAVTYRAAVLVNTGHLAAAAALIDEAATLTEVTGSAPLAYSPLLLRAWRGEQASLAELVESSVADARVRGEGRALMIAPYTTAVLHTALGDYATALAAAQRACEHDDLGLYAWGLIEVVEAAARSDRPEVAAAALERLAERTSLAGTDWALGIEARSRALLTRGAAAEALYREASERLGTTRLAIQAARARLLYGEWLRRENRRQDARSELRHAFEAFSGIGAEAFAERARRELLATGEKVRTRTVQTRPVLTAQETQIARLAGEGLTNPEIGSQLFISPRTVEYHLRKVFTKLDISSRRELRGALGPGLRAASPA